MAFHRSLLMGTTMIAGVAALAFAVPTAAFAQQTPGAPVQDAENQDDGTRSDEAVDQSVARATSAETSVEELVVTGSRIRRNEFTSAAPITVITSEGSTAEGLINASEILQSSSVAAGSTQLNNQFNGFVVSGGGGVNTISLRGLGDQRTLVLLNSRRLPPAGTQGQVGAVDLNILPNAVIERYEIVKDGASSIYGSDAIAGVVNVITRSDLDGFIVEAAGTASEEGGGNEYTLSGAYGKVLDRGRFQVSAEYYRQDELDAGDREDLLCQQNYGFDVDTGQRNDWIDVDTLLPKCSGPSLALTNYIPVYNASGAFRGSRARISTDGPAYPANQPIVGASNPDALLPGYRFAPLNDRDSLVARDLEGGVDIISPVERYTLYADGSYDLGGVELYGEFLAHRRESSQENLQQVFSLVVAPEAPCPVNPFNCPGASFSSSGGSGVGLYAPEVRAIVPYAYEQKVDVFRGVVGLRGDFNVGFLQGWDYDLFVSASRNEGEYTLTGTNEEALYAGIGGNWFTSDFTGICPPGSPAGCRPLELFTDADLLRGTFDEMDYLQLSETGLTEYTQVLAEGTVSGDLFDLPAGAVKGAFGASYRRDELNDVPGPNAIAQNYYNLATAGITQGDDSVVEAFGELEVPILRGMAFAENLTLNVSGRAFEYESFGNDATYKVGVNYQITPEFRVRTTYGTSFRAPALYEQFLGNQGGFLDQATVDPCVNYNLPDIGIKNPILAANCAAEGLPGDYQGNGSSAELVTGGGENLEAETSKAFSLGLIWTPEFADINIALDYFEIEVDNQVTSNGAAVVGQCYASADFPDNPFCDLFERNRDETSDDFGQITLIDASFRNILTQTNRGIDLTVRYTREIGPGEFIFDGEATWTLEDTQQLFPGFTDDFNGVIGEPAVTADLQFRYEVSDWTLVYSNDFVGRQSNYEYQGNDIFFGSILTTPQGASYRGKHHAEPLWYHHLALQYEADKWEATIGVRNLFDETPPAVSDALAGDSRGTFDYNRLGNYAFATQYDYIGRRFFLNVSRRF